MPSLSMPGTPLTAQLPTFDPSAAAQPNAAPPPVVAGGEDFGDVAAGLASLDFTLPERGKTYHFTTPRGQIEIEARPMAVTLLSRLVGLAGLAVAILVVWLVARRPARAFWRWACGTVACGVLLAVLGLASILTGILPVAGLVLLAGGIVLAIRNRCCPPIQAALTV